MKKASSIITLLTLLALYANVSFCQVTATDLKKLDWIKGTWKRTDTKKGETGHETWTRLSDTEWQGVGITMQEEDSSFVEKLKIVIRATHIYYVADIPGNREPVWYQFTEITENGFTCENPEYDFPEKIEYHKSGNKIKATISGDGKSIDYFFKRQKG